MTRMKKTRGNARAAARHAGNGGRPSKPAGSGGGGESRAALIKTRDVVIILTLDAPRETVFRAWTEPEQLAQWFGPRGYSAPSPEIEARPEGAVRLDLRGPDGTRYPNRGTVREIEAPERFAFETSLPDDKGSPILHVLNTVTFSEDHGRTTLTLKAHVLDAQPEAAKFVEQMHAGWSQTLDRLTEHVAK